MSHQRRSQGCEWPLFIWISSYYFFSNWNLIWWLRMEERKLHCHLVLVVKSQSSGINANSIVYLYSVYGRLYIYSKSKYKLRWIFWITGVSLKCPVEDLQFFFTSLLGYSCSTKDCFRYNDWKGFFLSSFFSKPFLTCTDFQTSTRSGFKT